MPLFKNIKQVREYITVSASNTDASVPSQFAAEDEYLVPVLGQTLLDTLQTEADALTTPGTLLKKCRLALAYLMYYKELPFIHTKITDTGLKNTVTDNQQTAYRYQYEDLLQQCESNGRASLEKVYEYLMANVVTYTDWAASDAYKTLNKNLIRSGTEFARYYSLNQPHRTFHAMQPIMQEVEDLYVTPSIGTAFFAELKAKAAPSDDEKEVLENLRKAIANLTIHKACTKLSVKVRPEGVTVMLGQSGDRKLNGEDTAGAAQLGAVQQDTYRDGNKYLGIARGILNAKASATVFATYFASELYRAPNATREDINSRMNGIYAL